MIRCSKCGFENQVGHIFCTRCRVRLNFSQLSDKDLIKPQPSGGRPWLRLMLTVDFLILVAVGLALWPSPVEIQRGTPVDLPQARRKIALMEKMVNSSPQVFSGSELNACLAAALESRHPPGAFELRSVQVKVKPNAIVLFAAATWKPLSAEHVSIGPFAITYEFTVAPEAGSVGFRFAVYRGRIGHLPLPGSLGLVFAPRIKTYFKKLRQDYPILGAVQRVELEDGKITVFLTK